MALTRVVLFVLAIATAALAIADPTTDNRSSSATGRKGASPPSQPSALISKQELAQRYPDLDVANIRDSILPGFYEVLAAGSVYYVTTDGNYMIHGDLTELATKRNVSENRRAESRAALLSAIDPATEIVFSPPAGQPKYRVTVFTDVDCPYCRKFHSEIAEVNALGIEVRYVSYPRTGPGTESWSKAEHVWCAADPKSALTQAKRGAAVDAVAGCQRTPVAEQYALGRRVGLTGTPAIYSDNGMELGGYLPPNELLTTLEQIYGKR